MRKASSSRRITLLIIVLPLLAMATGSFIFLVGIGRATLRRLPEVVRAAASERINGDVKIGKFEILPPCGLKLSDVAISGDTSDRPIIRVPTVKITFGLTDIALGKRDPIASIRAIEILKPDVFLERTPEGQWNIANLLKPQPPERPFKLRAGIYVKSGRATICDRAPNPARPIENTLTDISAKVDLSEIPAAKYSVLGKGEPKKLGRFAARGWYNFGNHSFNADFDIPGASASYLSSYPKGTGLNVSSGTARIGLRASRAGKDKPFQYAGAVRLRSVEARLPQIRSPVRSVDADIRLRGDTANIRLNGKVGSSPFFVSGRVFNLSRPRLALEVKSDSANFRELADLTGCAKRLGGTVLPQNGRFRAVVSGPAKSPGVDFTLEIPSLSHPEIECRSILAKGTYAGRRTRIRQVLARIYGGLVELSGDVALSGSSRGTLDGRVSDIPLGRIPALREHQFAAACTGRLQASWRPGGVRVDYEGMLRDGRFKGVQFDNARLSAAYADSKIELKELSVEVLGGTVTASGQAAPGDLKLEVAGSDINLASVREMYWSAPTVGRLNFTGELTGTLESPALKADIEAQRVMVSGVGAQRIAGSLSASRESVELADVVIHDPPGTVTLNGKIENPLAKTSSLNLRVKADSLDTDRLTQALGNSALSDGEVSGELTLSGTLHDPKAEGRLHIEGGMCCSVPIDSADAQIACSLSRFQLDDFTVRSGTSCLRASGEISKNRRISINFSGEQVGLDIFAGLLQPYAVASGNMAVVGSISGKMKSPQMKASVECDKPTINGQKFEHLSGRVSWKKPALAFSDFKISDASGQYLIPKSTYDSAARTWTLTARAQDIRGKTALALLDGSPAIKRLSDRRAGLPHFLEKLPRPLDGIVNGSLSGAIHLTNEGAQPDLRVEATAADVVFGSSSIRTVRMEGSWRDGVVKVETLEASDGDTNVSATAGFGPSGELALSIDAHSLPMGVLKQWVKLPENLSGKADVTIIASGNINAPEMDAAIEVVEPGIGRAKFDRLRSRLSANQTHIEGAGVNKSPAPGRIDVDDLTLILGDCRLSASGYVPVDWRRLSIPMDGPVLLESQLDRGSLELLSTVGGINAETRPDGAFEGLIRLGGTVQSPKLEGNLTWRDGRVRISRIAQPLEDIDASLRLTGGKLSIERFTGASAEGGSFSISGEVALANLKPVLDMEIKTDGLRISGENISNAYGEEIKARLNSDVKVVGNWQSPSIAGSVGVPEGSILLPAKGRKASEPDSARRVDPTFDIAASLGPDVQFRSARLRGPLVGQLAFRGSLSAPVLEGTLDISGGDIIFPMRELRILPGSTVTLRTAPSQRPTAVLVMRAQTRLTAASFLGQQKRYNVTMSAQGPLDKLNPTFSSSPPGLTDQTIIALLTGQGQLEQIFARNGSRSIGQELSGLFSTAMMPTVFEPIEQAFESVLGFEEFALEMGYREPIQLTVGEYLFDGFYLDYTAALGARPDYTDSLYELKLSYRFKHGIELGVTTDENHALMIGVEGKLRF